MRPSGRYLSIRSILCVISTVLASAPLFAQTSPQPTSTTVTSSANPSLVGQTVTFTATVSSSLPVTGTVTFSDFGSPMGTSSLSGTTATFSTSTLFAGTHSITATYSGDSFNLASTSAALSQVVNCASPPTPTIVASGPTTFCSGGSVTLSTSIAYNGYLWSKDGSFFAENSSVTVSAAGSYTVQVTDSNGCSGTSAPLNVVISTAPTVTTVTSSLNPSTDGQAVTFDAAVSPGMCRPGAGVGTPTIDGVLNGSEWSNAITFNFSVDTGTQTLPATLYVMNDATNVYFAVKVDGTSLPTAGAIGIEMPMPGSNVACADAIVYNFTFGFFDDFRDLATSCSSGPSDTSAGGTNDGTGAKSDNGTFTFYEISHPLNSGDLHDISVTAGNTLSWSSGDVSYCSSSCIASSIPTGSITVATAIEPTGTVTFTDNGTTVATASLSAGHALFTTSSLLPGTHTITATYSGDSNFLSSSGSVTQVVNCIPPSVSITTAMPTVCAGTPTTLAATTGYVSYLWSNGATTSSITVAPTTTTTYTVQVTDTKGCTNTASQTITVNPLPVASISGLGAVCTGGSVTLTASGGTSFLWSTGATTSSITVAPTTTTTYSVQVTDANGCSASTSKTVTVNPLPVASISGSSALCAGGSVTLTASGGTSFLWSTGATTSTITVAPTTTTTYSVQVTDANGCSASASKTINVTSLPSVSISAPPSVNANSTGNTATVTAGPTGTTYSWSITGGTITAGNGTPSITFDAFASGAVTLNVTVVNGTCSQSVSTNVTIINADLSITKTASPEPVTVGSALVYNILVVNSGQTAASNVRVVDTLPAGVVFGSTSGVFTCTNASGTLTCTLPSIAAGTAVALTINATAPAAATTITNTARVSSATFDPTSSNNVSSALSHVLPPPCPSGIATLLTPAAGAAQVPNPVNFTWTAVPAAIGYTVYGIIDGAPLQTFGNSNGTETHLEVTLKGTQISWFVRARFAGDCPSTDSPQNSFTLELPDTCESHLATTLIAPANNTTAGSSSMTFQWTPVLHANGYRVWASVGGAPFAALGTTQETSFPAIIPFGTVEWYVESLFAGCPSTESMHFTFVIPASTQCGSNTAASPIGPPNGATLHNQSVDFSWSAVPNAIAYEVYLSLNSGTFALLGTTTATTLHHDIAAGNLEWFVRTLFSGCPGVDSQHITFVFDPPPACPTQRPLAISPSSGAVNLPSPVSFRWTPVAGATQYRLTYAVNHGAPTTLVTTDPLRDSVAIAAGAVEWFVEAITPDCPSLISTTSTFVVVPLSPPCTTPDATVLRAPATASSDVEYTVRWNAIANVTVYEIEESPVANFIGAARFSVSDTERKFKHTNTTSDTVFYYYRVRGVNACDSARGPFSAGIAVGILPPRQPNAPSTDGATPVENPQTTTYQLQICTTAGPNCAFVGAAGQTFTATTDQPWLTVTPSTGTVPANGVTLTVTATPAGLAVGTNTGAVTVTFSGGSAQGRLVPHGGTTSSSSNISVNLVAPVANTPKNTPPPDALIIPAVAHADGLSSHFESDIRVSNTSPQPMKYQLTFTPSGESGIKEGKQTTIDIDPGRTVALDDVLQTWFGAGSEAKSATGALEIRPLTTSASSVSSSALTGLPNIVTFASSRTYSTLSQGSLGTYVPAIPFSNFIGKNAAITLQQVAQSDAFRTNLGLVEGSGEPATVLIKMFNDSGQKVGELSQQLNGGQHLQINQVLATKGLTNVSDGRLEVSVTSATGKVTAYASVLDNKTNDAQLVSPITVAQTGSAKYVLPDVAATTTDSGKLQSDVRLFNASSSEVKATLALHLDGSTEVLTKDVTLAAGQVQALDNVLETLFGKTGAVGALHITMASPANLVATAKTYTQTSAGSIGQFISAVTPQQAITLSSRPLQLLQVEESNRFTTDVGVAEVSGKPVDLEVSIIPQDAKVAAKVQLSLGANEFHTMKQLLKSAGLDSAYNARVTVKVVNGAGAATAYASTTDLATKDTTFMPAQ